jgi:carbonic anhydrase
VSGAEPSRHLVVVTCMDARIDPLRAFGLDLGEAHVLRNAGGMVTEDVLRSLLISQRLLGTREVMVVAHSGCGMLQVRDEELAEEVAHETGALPPMPLGGMRDIDEAVRRSVAAVRDCRYLPHRDAVHGHVLDIDTGGLREVV